MKTIILLCLCITFLASSCFCISRESIPEKVYTASEMQAAGLAKFEHREMTRCGFRLLFIPVSIPQPLDVVDALIYQNHAEGVTNLDVELSELNFLLFQVPKVRVSADLVRKK